MEQGIVDILVAAWQRVRKTLRGKPDAVRGRLQRGRNLWRRQPPRAWCMVIRASDLRITPATARCVPEHAAYPRECISPPEQRTSYQPHTVTIDLELLRALCAPIRIHEWGEPVADVAQRLGRRKGGLVVARVTGRLATRFHPPTGGRGGNPRPLVSAQGWLDPRAALFVRPDRVWDWTGTPAYWRVPDDLPPQDVRRVPFYLDRTRRYADKTGLHPEHPLVDPPPPRKGPSRKLAPPPPDHVAYKWKGDEFIGYDWRAAEKNPLIRENYERHQRALKMRRAAHARRARANPGPSRAGGSLEFRGWMWICPACGKRRKLLFYPLPPVNVVRGCGTLIEDDVIDAALALDPSLRQPPRPAIAGLACQQCHRVRPLSRVRKREWNEVVTLLSGGLLYGREVPRPPWFTPDRKRPFRPCLSIPPSRRRPQVQELLLQGLTRTQIARELGITKGTVSYHAANLYRQHGVHSLPELARKLGVTVERATPNHV